MKMIKRFTAGVIAVAMALSLIPAFALTASAADFANAAGGTGTEGDPYQISTADQLKALAEAVNGGEAYSGTYFKLTEDINLNGSEDDQWTPIGDESKAFDGTFDGGGYEITGLYIDDPDSAYQGLFGYVGSGGTVKNLSVSGNISVRGFVGGIVGLNKGTVENCYNTGSVTGNYYVGGIAGRNYGTVTNCYNTGAVSGNYHIGGNVGGVVGSNEDGGTVKNCYNTGNVKDETDGLSNTGYVGGVVGYNNNSTVENCYNTGSVTSEGQNVGGVVGYNYRSGTVENCYNTGDVSGKYAVGGVVGYNSDTVKNCYNTGSVSGIGDYSSNVSGVVGSNYGTVENCYNTGDVSGNYAVSGVVGSNNYYGTVTNCYNTGDVSGKYAVGGVVGSNDNSGTVTNCYYLQGTADTGIGSGSGTNVISKTDEEFKSLAEELGDAWKDSALWRPVLKSNPEAAEIDIPDLETLEKVRDYINAGNTGEGETFRLTKDIDLGGSETNQWTPIGNSSRFTGTFDGGGHEITGLYINSQRNSYQGLFGVVIRGGTVKNLGVSGTVTSYNVGGIVGYNNGTVENCYNTVTVSSLAYQVGGVVGYNNGTVENCHNTGTISSKGQHVGGVVGYNYSGTVENCHNTGAVTGNGNYVGGVVGYNYSGGTVQNCYNTGTILSRSQHVGGVVGYSFSGTVTNCYNTGTVTGNGDNVGGVVGSNNRTMTNCYNTGAVTGNGDNVGGVVGSNNNYGTVTNCYYLQGTADNGIGGGSGSSTNVEDKTTDQFASGEVARLLQDAQPSGSGQVWGQVLASEPKDASPVLTSDDAKKVLKVTFNKDDDEAEYRYTNPNGTVTVPTAGAGFTWAYDGEEFTSDTPVMTDMTVTAVEKFTAEIDDDIVTAEGTGQYAGTTASGFAAMIMSNLNRATISGLSVNVGDKTYTPNGNLPELTIDSGSGIVIGVIIPGITITSASDVTFNIE